MTLPKHEEELQAKYNALLIAAQDLCLNLDRFCISITGELCSDLRSPTMLRSLRELAIHCDCTHVTWWDKNLGK